MSRHYITIIGAIYIASTVALWSALPALDSPAVNVTERWKTNSQGWVIKDVLTDSTRDGWISNAFVVSHGVASNMFATAEMILAATNASSGWFSGNYTNCRIESISFEVNSFGIPPFDKWGSFNNPRLLFYDISRVRWVYNDNVIPCDTFSNWVSVTIPFDYSSKWIGNGAATGSEAFASSKAAVSDVGILIMQPQNMVSNKCAIRNFKLNGPWNGPFTNGVSVAWLAEHGLDMSNALNNTDKYGRPLDVEFLACTDPNDTNDVFKVEIARNEQGKTILKWKENNKYARYDLLEGTDLTDSNTFVGKVGLVDMQGSGTQKVAEVGAAAVTGPRFYKIQIRMPVQ